LNLLINKKKKGIIPYIFIIKLKKSKIWLGVRIKYNYFYKKKFF